MAGKTYDELVPGTVIEHSIGRTITEADNVLFNGMTMNPQPLHLDAAFAAQTEFGRPVVNGILTLGLVVGLTVHELSAGTLVANLGYEDVRHPHPMFHGDTLYVRTEVVTRRESRSRPDCGIVTLKHTGRNQDGVTCIEVTRSALFRKERPG